MKILNNLLTFYYKAKVYHYNDDRLFQNYNNLIDCKIFYNTKDSDTTQENLVKRSNSEKG